MGLFDKALMRVANRVMKDVGRFRDLRVNTSRKSCSGVLLLRGETEPIDVTGKYELVREGSKVVLQLRDVCCSREWMENLADRLEPQMNIDLPPTVASFLKAFRFV